jgi:hypothetical protein
MYRLLFGYLIVRALLVLVRVFGRLPDGVSRHYARLLDAGTRPFDVVNYLGSRVGAKIIPAARMGRRFDRVIAGLLPRPRLVSGGGCTIRLGGIRSSPTT